MFTFRQMPTPRPGDLIIRADERSGAALFVVAEAVSGRPLGDFQEYQEAYACATAAATRYKLAVWRELRHACGATPLLLYRPA